MKQHLKHLARRIWPDAYYWLYYRHGLRKVEVPQAEVNDLFSRLIRDSAGSVCLQIGVKEGAGAKFGPNWVSVDKFDARPFIDRHDDIHDLGFPDASFDVVTCISILEHVQHPWLAVNELVRVLKPGGLIWLQSPMAYPYHPDPLDLWRFTPDGLRQLASGCSEIRAGAFRFSGSLVASAFYYGRKV